jgi:DNA-binding IclR family transcriptional regulator
MCLPGVLVALPGVERLVRGQVHPRDQLVDRRAGADGDLRLRLTQTARGGTHVTSRVSATWKRWHAREVAEAGDGGRRSVTMRAASLLSAFDTEHRVLNLSALSRRSRLPLATVHRLAADLVEAGLLVRRADGGYEIGARLWRLGLLAPPTTLRELALPHLQDLVGATGHTVHLAVRDRTSALVIERLSGTRTLPTRHSPGAHVPLHCTAVGKALLAHADPVLVDEVVRGLRRYSAYTVTAPAALHRQLEEIRRTGLARSTQEYRLGVTSLAVPVHGPQGVVAALGLLAPLRSARLAGALPHLRAASASVSADFLRSGLATAPPGDVG